MTVVISSGTVRDLANKFGNGNLNKGQSCADQARPLLSATKQGNFVDCPTDNATDSSEDDICPQGTLADKKIHFRTSATRYLQGSDFEPTDDLKPSGTPSNSKPVAQQDREQVSLTTQLLSPFAQELKKVIKLELYEGVNRDQEIAIPKLSDEEKTNSLLLEHRMNVIVAVCMSHVEAAKKNGAEIKDSKSILKYFNALEEILNESGNGIIDLQDKQKLPKNLKDFVAVQNPFETLFSKLLVAARRHLNMDVLKEVVEEKQTKYQDLKFFVLLEEMRGLEALDEGINVLLYKDKTGLQSFLSTEIIQVEADSLDFLEHLKKYLEKILSDFNKYFTEYGDIQDMLLDEEFAGAFKMGAILNSKKSEAIEKILRRLIVKDQKKPSEELKSKIEIAKLIIPGQIKKS